MLHVAPLPLAPAIWALGECEHSCRYKNHIDKICHAFWYAILSPMYLGQVTIILNTWHI